MFFDVLKKPLEIFLLNPPPLSVITIRYQFYFRKHKISTEYQTSMLFDLLRSTFEIFYYNPPISLIDLTPILHSKAPNFD